MADSILRLRVESQEYDNKLKRAAEGLNRYIEGCRKAGGTLEHVDDGVKEFTQQLGKMETVAGGAKGKLGEMTKAFTDLTMQFNAMTEAEKRGQFGKALSSGLDELKQRIISTKQELADINSSLNGGSGVMSNLKGVLDGVAGKFGMSASMFTGVGAAVAGAAGAFKLLGDNISLAMNFEKSMSQLSSLTGMVGKDLDQLKEYAIELGSTSTLTASQVADAFRLIGSQQPQLLESGQALKEVTKYAITLSEAAGIDLVTAAQTLSTSINQMGGDSNNASRYVNVLAAASQKGAGDIAWLGEAITKAATAAKAVGTDYEELVANLEQLAKAGFDASTAGTALRSIIMNLEKQANNDFKPSVVGLTQAFENLGKANLDIVGYQQIAGKMFASQAMALANAAQEAKNMTTAITGTNTAVDQAKTNTTNLDGALKSLSSAWEGLNLHINSSTGFLKDAVDWAAEFIRKLDGIATAGGRAAKALQQMNGSGGEGPTKVDQQINALKGSNYKRAAFNATMKSYRQQLADYDMKIANGGKWESKDRPGFFHYENVDILKAQRAALAQMAQEYQTRGLREINPTPAKTDNNGKTTITVDVEVDTDEGEKSLDSLKAKLKELKKLRDEAINKKDFKARDTYNAQIKQVNAEIKSKRGGTTTTTTTHQTPQQRAQESFTKAEQNYKQALEQAAMELEAGTITRAEAKKKEMQAAEQRWKAIGDARNISDSPELKQAQDEAAAEYKRLAAEAKTATERQKALDKATRDLENANQKLATARSEMAQAKQQGDLQAYNTAKYKATAAQKEITRLEKVKVDVERGKVDLPDIPKVIEQTVNTHQGKKITDEIAKEITQTINTRLGRIVTPEILESITQTINTKIGRVVTPAIAKELTQEVNVKTGRVDLKPIPTELTQKVDVETGRVDLPDIPDVITQTINTKVGEVLTPEVAAEVVQTINTRLGRIVTPEILESITQTINTKIGRVVTPAIAKELTQEVNVKTGRVDLKPIPTEITQTVDVETGKVDLKPIPTEITQKVDVETGRVDLPDIPKVIEQTVNTHQGEMMTADIATEITQKINTVLGNIVKPEILDEVTQTINTKVGEVITPEIAKEVTQVVNVETGTVDLKPIPTEITQTVDVEQGDVNLPAIPAEVTQTVDLETGRVNLLNIPEVIEQTVNTHQGELMTADIATEITQKINTVLGNIVKPEILDEVTQTINTKVGEVITPEIAKEVTQVVNVETGTVDLEPIPTETTTTVDFQADTRNINAAISNVKKDMDTIPVGTIKFNLDQTKLVDLTTLKTLIDEQVKNGLEIDPEATQGLFSKIQLGIDIEDTTWQELIDKINEKLKDLGLDPIKIDLTTGETSKKGREKKNPYIQTDEKGNEKASLAGVMGGIANGMNQMVSGMESLGVEIPEGIKGAINAIHGVSTILTGIATTVLAIEALSTANLFWPFSNSGVVHAANGYVDGTTYSGDQIPAMLNAGEVVLSRGQAGVLAASLQAVGQSGEGGGDGKPYVSGEMIWLGLTNYLNRSGRGEIVTSKRR